MIILVPLNLYNYNKIIKIEILFYFSIKSKINQHALKMQEVPRENLVPGKEYYVENTVYGLKRIAKFDKLLIYDGGSMRWACFNNVREIKYKNFSTDGYSSNMGYNCKFYEIASREVQKNMENRAYNKVLLDLVKDEYFTPVDVI
jgi:hypothetical protein